MQWLWSWWVVVVVVVRTWYQEWLNGATKREP